MNPASFINQFRCFHVVAQEGVVAWDKGDIDGFPPSRVETLLALRRHKRYGSPHQAQKDIQSFL